MSRWLRLLVGAALSLIVLSVFALGVRYVYDRYAQPAESGLLDLLEYLFRPRVKPPPVRGPLTDAEIAACAEKGTFPDDYFSTMPHPDEGDAAFRGLYSRMLCAMGELPLSVPSDGLMRVRVVWLPTFDPGGSVRIEGNRIIVIDLARSEDWSRTRVERRMEHVISEKRWVDIRAAIDRASFWDASSQDLKDGLGIMDGVMWLVEVSEPGRYHMVHRMNGKALGDLPRYLYGLARRIPSGS